MAKAIEYHYGIRPNNLKADFFEPRGWHVSNMPPEHINHLWDITLDRRLCTEDATEMDRSEAKRRWKLLAPGHTVPIGFTVQTAVIFAEAIWLDTVRHHVVGHSKVINSCFLGALKYEPDMIVTGGRRIDWTLFAEIGEEAGVDLLVDAWLAGVPLEYVLAE